MSSELYIRNLRIELEGKSPGAQIAVLMMRISELLGEAKPQKVHVIMGNDFPDAAFLSEASANKYVADKKRENEEAMKNDHTKRKIYWRSYEFSLKE